jgi:chromosome segregation ATPase
MSLECYRSRGRNTYYNEGKRISKKMASSLSPKLPKCVSKTKSNEIKNLKKQLKEVLTHREQYKTTSADLDSRLKACSIVKGEYDRLVEMINSANSSVDVMNRVCLTKDLKKQIDREYRELRETLESTTRSYDEKVEQLLKIVEKNKLDIEAYQSEVLSVNEENNNLREALKENANIIAGLGQQINQLQNEKAALLEEVNIRERIIYDKNGEIEERMRIIGRLDNENTQLKNNINNLNDENENLKDDLEDLKEKATRYYNELNDALEENGVLSQRVTDAENTIENYTEEMTGMQEKIDSMENLLKQASETIKNNNNTIKEATKVNRELENELRKKDDTIKDKEFQISETGRMFGKLSDELRKSNSENNVLKQKVIDDAKTIENNTKTILKADSDIRDLENVNNTLRDNLEKTTEYIKETVDTYKGEFDILNTRNNVLSIRVSALNEENDKMKGQLEDCADDKEILSTQEAQIERYIEEVKSLRDAVQREKDECLLRIQQRIEETEGQISSRESKKYENQIIDLNRELLVAQEVIDDLKKAQTSSGKTQQKALNKAQKKMKSGPMRQVMQRVRY